MLCVHCMDFLLRRGSVIRQSCTRYEWNHSCIFMARRIRLINLWRSCITALSHCLFVIVRSYGFGPLGRSWKFVPMIGAYRVNRISTASALFSILRASLFGVIACIGISRLAPSRYSHFEPSHVEGIGQRTALDTKCTCHDILQKLYLPYHTQNDRTR